MRYSLHTVRETRGYGNLEAPIRVAGVRHANGSGCVLDHERPIGSRAVYTWGPDGEAIAKRLESVHRAAFYAAVLAG